MAASDHRQHYNRRHHRGDHLDLDRHNHSNELNSTNRADRRQQSPPCTSPTYRGLIVSSDSSFSASSCSRAHWLHLHHRFHQYTRSLVSSVASNFAFDGRRRLLSIEYWMMRRVRMSTKHTTSMQQQQSVSCNADSASALSPECTLAGECQCLLQQTNALSPSSSLSQCMPSTPNISSVHPSPTQPTLGAHLTSRQISDELHQRTMSRRHRARSLPAAMSSTKLWPNLLQQYWLFLLLTVVLSSLLPSCDTQAIPLAFYRTTAAYTPRLSTEEIAPSSIYTIPLNRTLTLRQLTQISQNRQIRQPSYNPHNLVCGEPPLVAHANSQLHRNQKHNVFPLNQKASYMCDHGYASVGGISETKCTFVESEAPTNTRNQVIFPDNEPHLVPLGSGRSKNSKRLMSELDEEEPDVNSSGHRSVLFPNNYGPDKRKMSRKTEDDLTGSTYILDGRSSDLENDSVESLEKRKQKMEKNMRSRTPEWWPPITLNCQPVNCTDPGQVEHAKRNDSSEGGFHYNSNVFYVCEEGYETHTIPILTCKATGLWNRPLPKCILKQCPLLPSLNNGRIVYTNERKTDSRAEYECDSGYRLNAISTVRHCRQDNKWSELDPLNLGASNSPNATDPYRCVPIECPAPVRPHAGLRIVNVSRKKKFGPGDVIIYSCESIKTKATAKCRPDGEWSREPPHCPELNPRCPSLPSHHFLHGNMIVEPTKVNFSCYEGFKLEGPSAIICTSNGSWSEAIPKCVEISKVPAANPNDSNSNAGILEEQQHSTTNRLTMLMIGIGVLAACIIGIVLFMVCKVRRDKLQRKRWQQYFGRYHHRQSKTNIVMSSTYNNLNGQGNGMSSGASSVTGHSVPATRHLLQRPRTDSLPHNLLQSSFSSSDAENAAEVKSFNTGTISSEHAPTLSSYADETSHEDEFEEYEEEDDDMYSNASILQSKMDSSAPGAGGSRPVAATRRTNPFTTKPFNAAESTPMILMNGEVPLTTSVSTLGAVTEHIYSNVPNPNAIASSHTPYRTSSPTHNKSNVPVTEL